jgi:hypothetical protein
MRLNPSFSTTYTTKDRNELEKAVRAELTARVAKTIAEQVAEGDIEPPQPNQPGPSGLMY